MQLHREATRVVVVAAILLAVIVVPAAGRGSPGQQTWIVYLCGEGHANLCGLVPETGERRQLTMDGDPNRPGTRSFELYLRGYRSPSLSPDGKLLSFAVDGHAFVAAQDAEDRTPVGVSTRVGFTSLRSDLRRIVLVNRKRRCIGGPQTGVCRGEGNLIVTTLAGQELRRIARVWAADWTGPNLLASRSGDELLLISGLRLRRERVLISRRRGSLFDPAVSPDGRFVAVTRVEQNAVTIAVYSLTTHGLVRHVTSGPSDWNPAWSPDGRQLVFSRRPRSCSRFEQCAVLFTARADGSGQPQSLGVDGLEPTWGMRRP